MLYVGIKKNTQLKKSDSYLCFYHFLSVLKRIGFIFIPKIQV